MALVVFAFAARLLSGAVGQQISEPSLLENIVEICVRNQAAFDAIFQLVNHNNTNATTMSPDMYPAPRTECLQGTALSPGASDGDVLGCRVNARFGKTNDCQGPLIVYNSSSTLRANYDCKGTSADFRCSFGGTEKIVGRCTDKDKDTWAKVFGKWPHDFKDCGLKCVGAAPCVNKCMIGKEGWTSSCASCMGDLVDCSKATGCDQDQACIQRNCMQAYFDCSGLFSALSIAEENVGNGTTIIV
jgi:hypothetical protein